MEIFDYIFVGSKLTNIVAIQQILKHNNKSSIALVSPSHTIGGHFASININNRSFDLGSVVHEFNSFNNSDSNVISEYNPNIRNDAGRYYSLIEDYIRENINLVRLSRPKMLYAKTLYDDIIFSNSFKTFNELPFKKDVKNELREIIKKNNIEIHPKDKHLKSSYKSLTYRSASLGNHGRTLHYEIFEPFFEKMTNQSTVKLLALYSRVAWLPLYYPETIFDLLNNKECHLSPTEFYYPSEGNIGALANKIYTDSLRLGLTHITGLISDLISLDNGCLSFQDGKIIKSQNIIWSSDVDRIIEESSDEIISMLNLERWSVSIVFALIEFHAIQSDFSCLYLPERTSLPYRIRLQSNQLKKSDDKAKLIIELNPNYAKKNGFTNDKMILNKVKNDLIENKIINPKYELIFEKIITLNNCITFPTETNISNLEFRKEHVEKIYPNVIFPFLNGPFSNTLNDQIIKGIIIAKNK